LNSSKTCQNTEDKKRSPKKVIKNIVLTTQQPSDKTLSLEKRTNPSDSPLLLSLEKAKGSRIPKWQTEKKKKVDSQEARNAGYFTRARGDSVIFCCSRTYNENDL